MLINETKLNKRHTLFFRDYNLIRVDREDNKRGGGTAIIIKKNIKYTQIHLNTENHIIEKAIIKIDLKHDNKLYLVSVYAKKGKQNEFSLEMTKIFEQLKLENTSNYYIIAGDFNAKHKDWANSENNERGSNLREWLNKNDVHFKLKHTDQTYLHIQEEDHTSIW